MGANFVLNLPPECRCCYLQPIQTKSLERNSDASSVTTRSDQTNHKRYLFKSLNENVGFFVTEKSGVPLVAGVRMPRSLEVPFPGLQHADG